MRLPSEVLESRFFAPAPADWLVAIGDIQSSTKAVEDGRHAEVNFTAAGMITALTNLCGPLPFQFGGDGAVALLPPAFEASARRELARLRRFARDDMGLALRVGLATVAAIEGFGGQIRVGRYEPTPGNGCCHFAGDGIDLFERSLKGRGDAELQRISDIAEADDDGLACDLTGLSCRWNPLRSVKGRIVTLVTRGADAAQLYAALSRIAGLDRLSVAGPDSLSLRWPPKGLMREARARRGAGSLWRATLDVLVEALIAYVCFVTGIRMGGFDPARYRREVLSNLIDFSRCGDAFNIVFDCPLDRVEAVRRHLEDEAAAGRLRFGMTVSEFALMTCLVRAAAEGQHVHFADGGEGGYTRAATDLKKTNP